MHFSVMSSCHQGSNRTQTYDMILIARCCVPVFLVVEAEKLEVHGRTWLKLSGKQ